MDIMTNSQVAAVFDQVADLLEFQGANSFRVRAYRNAARSIGDLSEPIEARVNDAERPLTDIAGIGSDLAEKCATLVRTGKLPQLEALLAETPESVLALLRVPGLGPKKASALHRELSIQTLDELRVACETGKVRGLKGFGAKTEQTILAGLAVAAEAERRIYWAQADAIAGGIRDHMLTAAGVERLELAGSYRRGKETVGDLDVLVVSSDAQRVMDHFAALPDCEEVLARGDTKMSIRVAARMQIDLRVVGAESFGAALQYFTGSKEHNVILRGMAKDRGLKINEYGVFRVSDGDETRIAGATESEVYAALDLPCFAPELREGRSEFEWAARGSLPRLLEVSDMQGDLHMHTTATDGAATLDEMIAAARKLGRRYIAITDHSKRVSMANGLDADRVRAQWREIDRKNRELDGEFVVLKGIECDILEAGGMDLPDDVLAEADWVLASIHYGQRQSREQITDRILGALRNRYVSAIAHPTGRLINQREPYEVDL